MIELTVSVPDEFITMCGGVDEARKQLQRLAVLDTVRRGRMSPSSGAEFLGMDLHEFKGLMAEHGIPVSA